MKRLIIGLTLAATTVIVPSLDAAADKPVSFTVPAERPNELNPCTGEGITAFLTFTVTQHVHRNTTIFTVKTTVDQTDGWTGGGTETQVVIGEPGTAPAVVQNVNLRVTSPDGDHFFVRKYRFKLDPDGTVSANELTFDCRR